MNNGWFLTMFVLNMINIGISLGKHGEEKLTEYNFIETLICSVINLFIIYMAIKKGF